MGGGNSKNSFSLTDENVSNVSSDDFDANSKFVNKDGGYTWNFDKNKGIGLSADSIDLSIHGSSDLSGLSEMEIPAGAKGYILDFGYDGILPYEATVTYNVGKDLAGKTLSLYHIEGNNAVYMNQRSAVDGNGNVDIVITECSSYLLVEQFTVTLPKADWYSISTDDPTTVYAGENFEFRVNIAANEVVEIVVKANNSTLTVIDNNLYVISDITADQTVTIEKKSSETPVDPVIPSEIQISYSVVAKPSGISVLFNGENITSDKLMANNGQGVITFNGGSNWTLTEDKLGYIFEYSGEKYELRIGSGATLEFSIEGNTPTVKINTSSVQNPSIAVTFTKAESPSEPTINEYNPKVGDYIKADVTSNQYGMTVSAKYTYTVTAVNTASNEYTYTLHVVGTAAGYTEEETETHTELIGYYPMSVGDLKDYLYSESSKINFKGQTISVNVFTMNSSVSGSGSILYKVYAGSDDGFVYKLETTSSINGMSSSVTHVVTDKNF